MSKNFKNNRFLAMLIALALVFSNVGVASAESTNGRSGVVDNIADNDDADSATHASVSDSSALSEDTVTSEEEADENESADVKIMAWGEGLPEVIVDADELREMFGDVDAKVIEELLRSSMTFASNQFSITVPDVAPPTSYTEVYERIMAWQESFPTGMAWDDYTPYDKRTSNGYIWKGGLIDGAIIIHFGCSAFVSIVQDGGFGNLPAKKINRGSFKFEDVRVGDILRINGNSHSVIVTQKLPSGVEVAEGNNSGKVFWGRTMSAEDVENADFILTRYPDGFVSADEAEANKIVDQGTEGSLTWSLTKRGVLTISGSGAMTNFSEGNMPSWSKTTYSVSSVVVESGITNIGNYAFYGSPAMSVDIPSTVTKIGDNAFAGSKLIGIDTGNVTTIGANAFFDCKNLASVTFAEGLTTIGANAFRDCINISGVLTIPSTVTSVGASCFQSCGKLMSVLFKNSSQAVTIGNNAFTRCWQMMSVKLPKNLQAISAGMFQGCSGLMYLYIPVSVKSIDIGKGTDSPFLQTSLMQIDFGGTAAQWTNIDGTLAVRNAYLIPAPTVNYKVEHDLVDHFDSLDTAVLEEVKAEVEALTESHYTAESWAKIVEALAMPETTQSEIDAKVAAIHAAIEGLTIKPVELPEGPDTAVLDAAKEAVEALTEAHYTAESWSKLAEALGLPETTQEEVDAKVAAIHAALEGLTIKQLEPAEDPVAPDESAPPTETATPTPTEPVETETPVESAVPTVAPSTVPTPTIKPTVAPGGSSGSSTGNGNLTSSTPKPSSSTTTAPTVASTATPTFAPNNVPTAMPTSTPSLSPTTTMTPMPTLNPTVAPTVKPTVEPEPTVTPNPTKYKRVAKVRNRILFDSNNKKADKYQLNKGTFVYKVKSKNKKIKRKNVKQGGFNSDGNVVFRKKSGTVKEIDHITGKIRTLYTKSIKKLIKAKKTRIVTKVKPKRGKTKKLKK